MSATTTMGPSDSSDGSTSLDALILDVARAAKALNIRVASIYPLGCKVTVQHPGAPMQATVVRHADGCYHAGELLVRAKSGGQQWIAVGRIITAEVQAP